MSEPTQLERLAKPFPPQYVKPPARGKYGDYIDHEIINQALLIILGPFSFEVRQVFYNPDGLLDGCTAALTATIDGREVTITEAGDCEHPTQKKTQGERLKNAASDALKRCAMRLGCGIHVWAGTDGDFFLYDKLRARRVPDESSGPVETAASASTADAPGSEPSSAVSPAVDGAAAGATSAPAASSERPASPERIAEVIARVDKMNLGQWVKDQHYAWPWDNDVCDVIEARCDLQVSAA